MREVAWKFADRVLVYADWDGFCELALPGELPGGVLRWTSRMLTTLGFSDYLWWLPYLGLGLLLGIVGHLTIHGLRKWRAIPIWIIGAEAYAVFPLLFSGSSVWVEPEGSLGVFRILGLAITFVCFRLLRPLTRHRFGLAAGSLACSLLWIPLAIYPLYAVFARSIACLRPFRPFKPQRLLKPVAPITVMVLVVVATCRWVYDDISIDYAIAWANGIRIQLSFENVADHIRMERLTHTCDWNGIVKIAEKHRNVEDRSAAHMETAYRLLAEYRLGMLPDSLFSKPIARYHLEDGREQIKFGGYLVLFNYGFLLPARKIAYEIVSASGWTPTLYRYLGDIAAIQGETALAYRNYRQLKRCPFYREFAERRLQSLFSRESAGFADLAETMAMASVWRDHFKASNQKFMSDMYGIETFAYDMFMDLRSAPPKMVGMFLTSMLLNGRYELLFENLKMMDVIYPPPRAWPIPLQEMLLISIDVANAEGRGKSVPNVREGVVVPETIARYREYLSAIRRIGQHPGDDDVRRMIRDWGHTYWCYDWLANPRLERKPKVQ